jgi:hypothetical protein
MEAKQLHAEGDRCPYPRPFPPGFEDCATFEGVTFIAADSNHRPLKPAISCGHLTMGVAAESGRFYPRCGLGTAADRLRWRVAVGTQRLEQARRLQQEFDEETREARERLLVAKAEVMRARFAREPRAALDRLIIEFLDQVQAFLDERADRYEEIGMPVASLSGLVKDSTRSWAKSSEVSLDEVLAGQPRRAANF